MSRLKVWRMNMKAFGMGFLLVGSFVLAGCGKCTVTGCGSLAQSAVDTQINNNSLITLADGKKTACTTLIKNQAIYGSSCVITWQ